MLVGNRYIISADGELNSTVYTLQKKYEYEGEVFYIYEYNLKLPFMQIVSKDIDLAQIIDKEITEKDNEKYDDEFLITAQNELWQKLFVPGDTIVERVDGANVIVERVNEFNNIRKITVTANSGNELKSLYLHLDMNNKERVYYVPAADFDAEEYKNDEDYTKKLDNIIGHGLYDLGIFDTQTTIEFYAIAAQTSDINFDSLYFAELDISKLQNISVAQNNYTNFEYTKTGMKFTVNGTVGQKVIIPATNLTGATAKINGETAAVGSALTAYMSIDLVDGENNIEITFTPMSFNMGLVVTIAALILMLILFLLNRFFNLTDKKWVQWVGVCIGAALFLGIAFQVFLKPFALTIITDIFRIGA
jgi:hypothetical protein